MDESKVLRVGQIYVPGVTRWPERAEYLYTKNGHELRLFWSNITRRELKAVGEAPLYFAVYVHPSGALWFCYQIDGTWSDAPFSVLLVPEEYRQEPPEVRGEERALITVQLINADNGVLEKIRTVSFSPDFTRILHNAIRAQFAPEFAAQSAEYEGIIRQVYARYDSSALARAGQARCRGGA